MLPITQKNKEMPFLAYTHISWTSVSKCLNIIDSICQLIIFLINLLSFNLCLSVALTSVYMQF